jgi:hypothetical protein
MYREVNYYYIVVGYSIQEMYITLLWPVWRRRYWIANLRLLGFGSLSDLSWLHMRFFGHVQLIDETM